MKALLCTRAGTPDDLGRLRAVVADLAAGVRGGPATERDGAGG